jgi:hypothetical protein
VNVRSKHIHPRAQVLHLFLGERSPLVKLEGREAVRMVL